MSAESFDAAKHAIADLLLFQIPPQIGEISERQLMERLRANGHAAEDLSAALEFLDKEGLIWGRYKNVSSPQTPYAVYTFLPTPALRMWFENQARTKQAEETGAPRDQGGAGQGEGDGESVKEQLKPSREKAYRLFQWAMEQKPDLKTDRDVYDWLNEYPDLPDELPTFATWCKYLREARAFHKDHKHTPRTTKVVSGKSVVRRDRI